MFIGYPRSGHSLVGSLLDAHPNIIVAQWPVSGFMIIFKLLAISFLVLLTFLLLGEFGPDEIEFVRSLLSSRTAADYSYD